MNNWWPNDRTLRLTWIAGGLLLLLSLFWHLRGVDHLLDWTLTATAEKENIIVKDFEQGPFNFQMKGQQYLIQETFSISDFQHSKIGTGLLLLVVWLGLTGLLTYATYLRRYAFIVIAALYLLMINQLYLDEIGLLGSNSWKWASILLMAALLLPAYYLHAFREQTAFLFRWMLLSATSLAVLLTYQWLEPSFYLYIAGHGSYAMAVMSVLFIFLIAEEILFLVILFITRSKGGTNNEKHFLIFSTVYLLYLGLYWADQMGLVGGDWDYLNPYYLLLFSTLIAFYTLHHKQSLFDSLTSKPVDIRWLLIVLMIGTFGVFSLGDIRGNDPLYDGVAYFILYAHLGFGIMFLLYMIVNLMTPLMQGLMVYKVVYKEHNFPYITARLAGFIFIVGFYFYSDQAPLRRVQAARLNLLGDFYEPLNPTLARSYFEESAVFGWDNHYASMKLAQAALQRGELNEAIYRFNRAIIRNPSPYAYVAAANALKEANELTRAISVLRQGQLRFPNQPEILNNLALLHASSGAVTEALEVLNNAGSTDEWNQATTVNQLALGQAIPYDPDRDWNWQAQTNWQALANTGQMEEALAFETSAIEQPMSLPIITYLINSAWNTQRNLADSTVQQIASSLRNRELAKNLKHSHAYNLVYSGYPDQAIPQWEALIRSVNSYERGFYYEQLGYVYLQLQAPLLASDAFEKGITYNSEACQIGYAVAQMELKNWSAASAIWQQVAMRDSSYAGLIEQTQLLQTAPLESSFAWLYYEVPDDIGKYDIIAQLPENQARMLWDKLFDQWSATGKKNDLAILTDRIQSKLSTNQLALYHNYQQALQDPAVLTYDDVRKNAFDEWKILTYTAQENLSIDDRYNILLEAIAINSYDKELIIAYVKAATEMGLYDYAENATLRLLDLVSTEEYQAIERMVFDLRQEREEKLEEWSF